MSIRRALGSSCQKPGTPLYLHQSKQSFHLQEAWMSALECKLHAEGISNTSYSCFERDQIWLKWGLWSQRPLFGRWKPSGYPWNSSGIYQSFPGFLKKRTRLSLSVMGGSQKAFANEGHSETRQHWWSHTEDGKRTELDHSPLNPWNRLTNNATWGSYYYWNPRIKSRGNPVNEMSLESQAEEAEIHLYVIDGLCQCYLCLLSQFPGDD